MLNVPDPGAFAALYSEVRGDIHAALGNHEAASSAYTDALLGAASGGVNTEYIQLKLNDVFQSIDTVVETGEAEVDVPAGIDAGPEAAGENAGENAGDDAGGSAE